MNHLKDKRRYTNVLMVRQLKWELAESKTGEDEAKKNRQKDGKGPEVVTTHVEVPTQTQVKICVHSRNSRSKY